MPTLLLHSAISFEKLNDKENAKSFYATLVDLYPSSSEAKIAKTNLKNL
jgi:TolA-binding protein